MTVTQTIQAKTGQIITAQSLGASEIVTSDPAHPDRQIDAIRIAPGVRGVKVIGPIRFITQGSSSSAVSCAGIDCTIANITQAGHARALTVSGSQNCVADLIFADDAKMYGVFGGVDGISKLPPRNFTMKRFKLVMNAAAQHAIRVEGGYQNVTFGDPKLTLPGENFAGIVEFPNHLDAITFRNGTTFKMYRVRCNGSFSAYLYDQLWGKPGYEKFAIDGVNEIGDCEFHVGKNYFWLGRGLKGLTVTRTKIYADAPAIRVDAGKDPWCAGHGTFTDCELHAPAVFTSTSPTANVNTVRTILVTPATHKLGIHGEILP